MSNAFPHIIGQTAIKSRLEASINAPENTDLSQPIFFGEAGLGKTELGNAYALAMAEKLGCEITHFNSPEEFRHQESAELSKLLTVLESDEPAVIVIDEIHKITEKTTISMQKVHSFFLKALDGQNKGKMIQFDQDRVFTYDKSKKVVIFMTNYENRVNPALASRMDICRLSAYNTQEMEQIALLMLARHEMTPDCEKTLKMLALASRGTARPLYNLVQHLVRVGEETITMEAAIRAMVANNMFPKGLTEYEVRLIEMAKLAKPKQVLKLQLPNLARFNDSVAYMMGHGFLELHGQNIKASSTGLKFLAQLKSAGFLQAA